MNKINFAKNYNNKLNCDYFTTIRLFKEEKWIKYFNWKNNENIISITLNDEEVCKAQVVSLHKGRLLLFSPEVLIQDTGLEERECLDFFQEFYGDTQEWKESEGNPYMIILLLKKVKG
jgi:hypothetical protein